MGDVHIDATDDLGVIWDPEASRLARVLVSDGRIEILLCEVDHDWVKQALDRIDGEQGVALVIACPNE